MEFVIVCLSCILGNDDGHTAHSMVRFVVEEQAPLVVHDITEATDEEIGSILSRAFGEPA